ncbi:cellular tumor antigen p53 isoform X1 [Nasonia vitripennis]|uniref:p53 DNA-binding domain-containing protein n=2 Tax=Nasonia vitripennis TaxID=7425 RepID=A0A7M7GGS0_NASVI|nr:cellular tumor antigen p53 isoform X1 [Nasonia vitripennis]
MTREGSSLLTNSQEEQLLQEYATTNGTIDIDPLQFSLSLGNLGDAFGSHSFANCEYVNEQTNVEEDKLQLQQMLAMSNQQQMVQQIQPQQQQQPSIAAPILGKDEFAGEYNFQLILKHHQNNGKHWVYSEKLSKVFIHMEEVLPLHFQWTPPTDGLWVRATMVYKLDQHRSQPVQRCHNHMAPDNNSNRSCDPRQLKHVIRGMHGACTYEEASNGHLSVLTPLGTPEAGMQNVPMDFVFYCKNSCTSGMNRRPTEVIFTLETDQNKILGRRKLEVRVCSCPKRDKEKEEKEHESTLNTGSKKRKSTTLMPGIPPGKKLLMDKNVFEVNLKILGRDNYNAVIRYAHDIMAGAAIRTGSYDLYKPYMEDAMRKSQ